MTIAISNSAKGPGGREVPILIAQKQAGDEVRLFPVFICDVCRHRILSHETGICLFDQGSRVHGPRDTVFLTPMFAHLGPCEAQLLLRLDEPERWEIRDEFVQFLVNQMGPRGTRYYLEPILWDEERDKIIEGQF